MPLVVIRRKKSQFKRKQAQKLGDSLIKIVAQHLEVKPHEVEVQVRKFKKHDLNCPAIGINIDTGAAKNGWRLEQRERLAFLIQRDIKRARIIPQRLLSPTGPYIWLRIIGSSFVPIGYPKAKR